MTDTEAKALVRSLMLIATNKALPINYRDYATGAAHYIEATEARHQADKDRYEKRTAMLLEREARHAAELREQAERFSEVAVRVKRLIEEAKLSRLVYDCSDGSTPSFIVDALAPFILPAPDPLVEALNDMKDGRAGPTTESYASCLRAALAARGGKIVWGEDQ